MRLNLLFLGACLLLTQGCSTILGPSGLSYEGKWKRILEVAREINAELETVSDKASSEQAVPRLQSLVDQYNDLDAAIENSSANSMDQMDLIAREYMQPLMDELMTIGTHSLRCQFDPELGRVDIRLGRF